MRGGSRRVVAVFAAGAAVGLPVSASGADSGRVGLEVALGVGLSAPVVPAVPEHDSPSGPTVSAGIGLTLDAGLRTRHFFLGPALHYVLERDCCNGFDLQVGAEGRFYGRPDQVDDPWLGIGVAYEEAQSDFGGNSGWTVDVRGGTDLKGAPADAAAIGPFLSVSFGEYTHEFGGASLQPKLHEWFTVGVRVVWDPR